MNKVFPEKLNIFFHSSGNQIATLALIGFIFYGLTILNNYNIDDYIVVKDHPQVQQGLEGIPEIVTSYYNEQGGNKFLYRPLAKITFALEFAAWGEKPGLSHFINVILYILGCLALLWFLNELFPYVNPLFPFFLALLFTIHPIHSEVVCSLKNREELLSFICWITSITAYMKFNKAHGNHYRWLLLSLMLFTIALFAKSTGIGLFMLIALVSFQFFQLSWRRSLTQSVLYLIPPAIFFTVLALWFPESFGRANEHSFSENHMMYIDSFADRIATAFYTLGYYVRLLLYPHPLQFFYGYNTIPIATWQNPWVLLSFFTYLAIFIIGIITFKKYRILSFGIFFYLFTMTEPSNLLVPLPGGVSERFLFKPSVGFSIVLGWCLVKLFRFDLYKPTINLNANTKTIAFGIMTALLVLTSGYKTISRSLDWKNKFTLVKRDVKHAENSANVHIVTALAYKEKAMATDNKQLKDSLLRNSIKHIKKVNAIWPHNPRAFLEIGKIFKNHLEQPDSAIYYFDKLISKNSKSFHAYYMKGETYYEMENYELAIKAFRNAMDINKKHPKLYKRLTETYLTNGDTLSSQEMVDSMRNGFPNHVLTYRTSAKLALANGNAQKAIGYLEEAYNMNDKNEIKKQIEKLKNKNDSIR